MRNALILLSSLALATSSGAVGTATVTSTGDVTYTLGPGLSYSFAATSTNLPGRAAGNYVYDWDSNGTSVPTGHNPVYEYLDDTNYDIVGQVSDPSRYSLSLSGGASGTANGANRLLLTSTATFSVPANEPGDPFVFRRYGYRYFMQVINDTTVPQFAVFSFNEQRRVFSGSVDVAYDQATNFGQYAEAGGIVDVFDTSMDESDGYSLYGDTSHSATGRSFSRDYAYPIGGRGFTVALGATVEYEIFSSSYLFIEDDHRKAVPEPASMLALGLGAVVAMRRRRR